MQCWTSLEEFFGVVPCTVMSMMSNELMSSACEVDICGVIGMHALRLASGTPSALLDWNNNYGDDPDKAVCFHCSNLPKHFFEEVRMDYQAIIAGTVGRGEHLRHLRRAGEAGPDELRPLLDRRRARARSRGYVGRGRVHRRSARRPSAAPASSRSRSMQELLRYICENGFEHHVAANLSSVADDRPRGDDEVPRVGGVLARGN